MKNILQIGDEILIKVFLTAIDDCDNKYPYKVEQDADHMWIRESIIFGKTETEKPELYQVVIPNPDDSNLMLFKLRGTSRMFFEKASYESKSGFESKLTEVEILKHGFGWVFACGFAQEVE